MKKLICKYLDLQRSEDTYLTDIQNIRKKLKKATREESKKNQNEDTQNPFWSKRNKAPKSNEE